MAPSKDPKIRAWRKVQRYYLRVIDRALKRDADAVRLRYRRKSNAITRRIRHRRKVLSVDKKRRQGLVWYDGKQVAAWIADDLDKARAAGWRGYVVSGYRTPAYSETLCYRMCGRPSCPGRCAGRSSNHSQGYIYPRGAVDVTDFLNLAWIAGRKGLRIQNRLPRDRVHFSSTGV
jgi:hypothetical protein